MQVDLAYLMGQVSVGVDPLEEAMDRRHQPGKHGVMPCSGSVIRKRTNAFKSAIKTTSSLSRVSQIRLRK